jgi:hypothetical protein
MVVRDTPERLARYVAQVASLTAVEPRVRALLGREQAPARVLAVVCPETPEPGYVTGFSYGLSLVDHSDWGSVRRELCLTVRSDDAEWAMIPARMVAALRGMTAFNPGQAFSYAERFVEGSPLSSAVLAEPAPRWRAAAIDLGSTDRGSAEPDTVEFVGVYPVYPAERDMVYAHGFAALWQLEWDRFDPSRPPVA